MRARQREACCAVIERRSGPRRRRVADRTICRESRRKVVRIRRSRVVRLVATVAIRWCGRVVAVDVAAGTGNRHVGPGQRELRIRVVIEGCR